MNLPKYVLTAFGALSPMSRVRTVKKEKYQFRMNVCSQDTDLLDVSHAWLLT